MRITVGLPFFNNRNTLSAAIRSVYAQTLTDWELICIDDGSTDGSIALLEEISDPRVRVFRDGLRCGLAARLNQVADVARGAFVARMDADDLMHPQRLERQLAHFLKFPEIDVLGTRVYSIDPKTEVRGIRGSLPQTLTAEHVLRNGTLLHPTVLARRQWFLQNRYDENWGRVQDRDLWCRTFATTIFAEVPEPLLFYREDADSAGFRKRWRSAIAELRLVARHGIALAGWRPSLAMASRSLAKLAINPVLHLFRGQNRLFHNRCRALSPAEAAAAADTLETILTTPVPGWEDLAARRCHTRGHLAIPWAA